MDLTETIKLLTKKDLEVVLEAQFSSQLLILLEKTKTQIPQALSLKEEKDLKEVAAVAQEEDLL